MKVLLDTNVFTCVFVDEDEYRTAVQLLNTDKYTKCISQFSIIELRHTLTSRHHIELEHVNKILGWIEDKIDKVIGAFPSLSSVNKLHISELLDPADCILYGVADDIDAQFVSIENELQDAGAKDPEELL